MQDNVRIGAAALGGYVLGRTKKGKAVIGLALWLSGHGRPRDILRNQAIKALQTEEAQEVLAQLRGPLLSAGRSAAASLLDAQAGRVGDSLKGHARSALRDLPSTLAGLAERTSAQKDGNRPTDEADADADADADEGDDGAGRQEHLEDEQSPDEGREGGQQRGQGRRPRPRAVWSRGAHGRQTAHRPPRRPAADQEDREAVEPEGFEGVEAKRAKSPIRRVRQRPAD
jgi:hypothetical protein